jgi:two-component system, chemotaxis family, chemotaxis protein CheY
MKILIVDDSAMMRTLIKRTIEEHDEAGTIEIVDASNGQDALEIVEHQKVDLVLVDWNMPVVDGLGFVRRVRADGNAVPIVMVSAVSDETRIFEAAEAGVNAYIEKPVRSVELWQRIREYVA